jgi:P27 family predicted phage terminase small subunit
MAGRRQPINLVLLKGRKHLTKEEIEKRKSEEVKAPANNIKPPSYLSPSLKKEFRKIADQLKEIGLISNLDVDALARFVLAKEQYIRISELLRLTEPILPVKDDHGILIGDTPNPTYSELLLSLDKLFKQCRQSASDFGLTISSRCRLVLPKPKEKEKTEFDEKFGDV